MIGIFIDSTRLRFTEHYFNLISVQNIYYSDNLGVSNV
jgi:hypothetical protein